MSYNNENNQKDGSEDERQLDEQKNQKNKGICKNGNEEGQGSNPALNFNGQNGNGLTNKDNNNDNFKYGSPNFIGQKSQQNNNPNNQMNNFINGFNNNNQVPIYNPNNNDQNSNNNNQNLNNNINYQNLNNNNNNQNLNNINNNQNINNNKIDQNLNNNNNLNINNNNNNQNINNNNNQNLNNNNLNLNNNYPNLDNINNNINNNNHNFNNNNNIFNNNMNNNNVAYGNNNLHNYPNNNNQMNNNNNQMNNNNQNQNNNNQMNNNNQNQNNMNQINNNNQNQNNMNQINNQRIYPFSNIKNPIKTLLIKLGKTEYLNAILYLIGNIKVLCEYFYNPQQNNNFVKNIEQAPLSFIFHRLFLHLYPLSENEKTKSYKPDAFKKYLSEINCVYKSENKRNPNDLFSFILETLHNELKRPTKAELKIPKNVFNKKDVIQAGIKNFKNYDISKISGYFNWFELKETTCTQCNQTMYSFHTYHMFELDILNTSKYNKNKNNNVNSNNSITIYDCLSYYQSRKNNVKAYCKSCHKNTIVNCGSKIFSNPNIFVFSLNRGLINDNFNNNLTDISFQLYEQIDLSNFIDENNQVSKYYELKGIISISRQLKNYVTFSKSPVDNNWYFYDSDNVCSTDINKIISEHDIYYIPCILVYQLV